MIEGLKNLPIRLGLVRWQALCLTGLTLVFVIYDGAGLLQLFRNPGIPTWFIWKIFALSILMLLQSPTFWASFVIVGASSWILHMAFIILTSIMWGFVFSEWKGVSKKTLNTILIGITVIILSVILVGYGNSKTV